jgi:hypothetical protein
MRLLLSYILYHFDVELDEGMDNWMDQRVFILWERKPLMIKLKPIRSFEG